MKPLLMKTREKNMIKLELWILERRRRMRKTLMRTFFHNSRADSKGFKTKMVLKIFTTNFTTSNHKINLVFRKLSL